MARGGGAGGDEDGLRRVVAVGELHGLCHGGRDLRTRKKKEKWGFIEREREVCVCARAVCVGVERERERARARYCQKI